MRKLNFLLLVFIAVACSSVGNNEKTTDSENTPEEPKPDSIGEVEPLYCNENVRVGAERIENYLEQLKGKKVGLIGNPSSMVGERHLVDTLLARGINIVKVFSPEHGFRGDADAGEEVKNGIDTESGLPVISLYGKNKKPSPEQLADIDILIFDMQDVGARFYTYISTLHYVMAAAAENGKPLIVLDRPNPNGHYVDGPVLKSAYSSFVGMHEVPVVHGMTIGEYAQMINGEGWLGDNLTCQLEIVPCEGWDHNKFYELPIAPSPNLPNMVSVYLYPSLCFFEGTVVSIGRGTDYPFQVIGHPKFEVDVLADLYSFTPQPNEGASKPKLENELCYGYDLHDRDIKSLREKGVLDLSYLIEFYTKLEMGDAFFLDNNFIDLLAGSDKLKEQIIMLVKLEDIVASWQEELKDFKEIRTKYLLYTDFE